MFRRFETSVDPFQSYPETTPPAAVWPFLVANLRPFRRVIAVSLFFCAVGAAIEVWLIGYAGQLVDRLATTSPERLWADLGGELLVAAAVILVLRPVAAFLREARDDVAFRPNAETLVRWRAHRHVLGQSVGWFRTGMAGRTANRVREIGTSATGAAYALVHTLSFVVLYIGGALLLLGSIDPWLIVPLGVWLTLYLGLMAWIVPRYRAASEAHQAAQSALSALLVDTYANVDTIKLYSTAAAEDRESRAQFEAARAAFFRVQRLEVTINSTMILLGSLLIVALAGIALVRWQAGDAPLGLVAAALALSFRLTGMAEWLLDAVSAFFGHLGAMQEALRTVAQRLDIADEPDAPPLSVTQGTISVERVSHHYGRGDGGLRDVTLVVAGGEKVGLVGPSGAGKSTLVNLILRFFEPESGTLSIDGQDIRSVTQESLRRHIAMVAQDASLLHRSVRDNIAYGREDVTDADIEAAARKAAADGFIAGLHDAAGRTGYAAHVGERGVILSGGQRQRIALARAFLKDAPILILDEATSALDSEVEAAIQDTLETIMQGRTVIAIAHRLSTIAKMDRIVVLDGGRIVETGPHAELLAAGGLYARLWARQSGGFIGTAAE